MRVRMRLRRAVEKSWPEIRVLAGGLAPAFVYGARAVRALPVFAYHGVDHTFEHDLELLAAGGYRTVGATEVEAFGEGRWEPDSRAVALTFDDGDASLVKTAVPLLERYGFRALAFVVAGLVPEKGDGRLAGWAELGEAVERGVLDVGSHSLYHHQVPVSPRILDFVAPSTDTGFEANIPVPRVRGDERKPLGAPIHPGAPRYALRPAFIPDPEVEARCAAFAREEGPALFRAPGWRRRLREVAGRVSGRHESPREVEEAVGRDIARSLRIVAERCPNPGQGHLCYPWYASAERADELAARAGVRVVHKGIEPWCERRSDGRLPAAIRRLPPDFLGRLPGPARRPLHALAARRLRTIASGPA